MSNEMSKRAAPDADTPSISDNDPPLTLPHIKIRIQQLLSRLPSKEETCTLVPSDIATLEEWCRRMRKIMRSYNLVLNFLGVATYQWEPDRPGHTGQSLTALNNQVQSGTARVNVLQSDISRILTPPLTRQLTKKRLVTQISNPSEAVEIKEETYEYEQVINDPEMLSLNRQQLCDEAVYKRQFVVSAMEQMCQCIDDYMKAEAGAAGRDGQGYSMAY